MLPVDTPAQDAPAAQTLAAYVRNVHDALQALSPLLADWKRTRPGPHTQHLLTLYAALQASAPTSLTDWDGLRPFLASWQEFETYLRDNFAVTMIEADAQTLPLAAQEGE